MYRDILHSDTHLPIFRDVRRESMRKLNKQARVSA